ncbi:MAG: replicative DNA helicase [Colwellia sp.]|nr:replicative DNA helicase [Colwellia sp.]
MELGKLPPQNIKSEQAVLGALLVEPNAFVQVSDIVKAEMFYEQSHQLVFESISKLFADNQPIDLITVTKELQKVNRLEEVGGAFAISELMKYVATAAHIETHAAMIHDSHVRRLLIAESVKLTATAYDNSQDLDTIINSTVGLIDRILKNTSNKAQILPFSDHLETMCQTIQDNQKIDDVSKQNLIPSCSSVRQLVKEYKPGGLYVIAGRPAMGKTAYALNEANSFVKVNEACLFFSLEMTAQEMTKRVFSAESGITNDVLDSHNMPNEFWMPIGESVNRLYKYPLLIDDTPLASFAHIKTQAKIYKQRHDIKSIVIDYLQLMEGDKSLVREQQIAQISKQLKALAKELMVPIFLLAQLNRNADSRSTEGYKPKLSDLRESGAIEQDADVVMFPYRPEYYYKDDQDIKGKGFILVEKNRGGRSGEAPVDISPDVSRWTCQDDINNFEPSAKDLQAGFESDKPF